MTLPLLLAAILTQSATRPNEAKDFGSPTSIQRHLLQTHGRLSAREPAGLGPEQVASRRHLLGRLRAYAERGVFPHNHHVPGQRPVFIDAHGTACAVGQLIIDSGHRPLAERLRDEQLYSYLLEMGDAELERWVAASGFTAEELADIQPSYTFYAHEVAAVAELVDGRLVVHRGAVESQRSPSAFTFSLATPGAVAFEGAAYYLRPGDTVPELHRLSGESDIIEKGRDIYRLATVGGRLFGLGSGQVLERQPDGSWKTHFEVPGTDSLLGAVWALRAADDVWLIRGDRLYHYDGARVVTTTLYDEDGGPFPGGELMAVTARREVWVRTWAGGPPVRLSESSPKARPGRVSGSGEARLAELHAVGDDMYAVMLGQRPARTLFRWNEASSAFEAVPGVSPAFTSVGVSSSGKLVVVEPHRAYALGDSGAFLLELTGKTSAKLVSVTQGRGLTFGVELEACQRRDEVCPEPPPVTGRARAPYYCSVAPAGALAMLALLSLRRVRSRRAR